MKAVAETQEGGVIMVSAAAIEEQLKKIGFKYHGWGRTEVKELQRIILPDEEIYECANGFYEGGFALLLATDVRVLLVDKKPLNYLTVEDLRFDMINEIDYSHRLFGAYIRISAGETSLKFTSINQPRLRKLIGHVQFCMAEAKKKQATHPHLEQINQQLQSYLLAQYQQQQKLQDQLQKVQLNQENAALLQQPEPIKPSPQLADYLYTQSLLAEHQARTGEVVEPLRPVAAAPAFKSAEEHAADLYADGREEVFGKHKQHLAHTFDINPLRVAYSKLPHVLHSRKFNLPLLPTTHVQEGVSLPTEA
jgi:hypothetical protein